MPVHEYYDMSSKNWTVGLLLRREPRSVMVHARKCKPGAGAASAASGAGGSSRSPPTSEDHRAISPGTAWPPTGARAADHVVRPLRAGATAVSNCWASPKPITGHSHCVAAHGQVVLIEQRGCQSSAFYVRARQAVSLRGTRRSGSLPPCGRACEVALAPPAAAGTRPDNNASAVFPGQLLQDCHLANRAENQPPQFSRPAGRSRSVTLSAPTLD